MDECNSTLQRRCLSCKILRLVSAPGQKTPNAKYVYGCIVKGRKTGDDSISVEIAKETFCDKYDGFAPRHVDWK